MLLSRIINNLAVIYAIINTLLKEEFKITNIEYRNNLIEKISKAQELQKINNSKEESVYLTSSELRLVKIGLKALHAYEQAISEEFNN